MTKEDFQSGPNEEVDQDRHDYIEHWFHITINSRHHSLLLLQLFVSNHLNLLVFHAFVHIKVYISNLSMNVYLYLLHTWLHWKYSYTEEDHLPFFK